MLKPAFPPLALVGVVALAACGGQQTPAANSAEALEQAAEQSNPAAAAVLENAAEEIREGNVQDPAAVQQALEQAGRAQVQAGRGAQTKAPDPAGAKPHEAGDPVPPPQTRSAPPASGGGASGGTKAGGSTGGTPKAGAGGAQDHSGHSGHNGM